MPRKGQEDDLDEYLEEIAGAEIDLILSRVGIKPAEVGLWRHLPHAGRAARRRLLVRYLAAYVAAGLPPPSKLVDWIRDELDVSDAPLSRAKDPEKVKAVARYHVYNPDWSLRSTAEALELPRNRVSDYTNQRTYLLTYWDELSLACAALVRLAGRLAEHRPPVR